MKVPQWFKEGVQNGELNFNKVIDKESNVTLVEELPRVFTNGFADDNRDFGFEELIMEALETQDANVIARYKNHVSNTLNKIPSHMNIYLDYWGGDSWEMAATKNNGAFIKIITE